MKILFVGDVVGRTGRTALQKGLSLLKSKHAVDFCIVNGENATSGAGLNRAHAQVIFDAGADCITLGDHAFDQKDMLTAINSETRIIRPSNLSKQAPGRGFATFEATRGRRVLVAQVLGRVFMKQPYDDPFSAIDAILKRHTLGAAAQAIVVDVHAEATSEKMALGHWCDGRASLVVRTHTHVPTADATILRRGTGYLTDAGMCGSYDSIIGMDKEEPLRRFLTGMSGGRFVPAAGAATLCGILVETDDATGLARSFEQIRFAPDTDTLD